MVVKCGLTSGKVKYSNVLISSKVLESAFSKHKFKAIYEKDKPKGFKFNISRLEFKNLFSQNAYLSLTCLKK